jgi:hypothetical protein
MDFHDDLGSGVWDDVPSSSPMIQRDLDKATVSTAPLSFGTGGFNEPLDMDTNTSTLQADLKSKLLLNDKLSNVPSVTPPPVPSNPLFHDASIDTFPSAPSSMRDPLGTFSNQPLSGFHDPLLGESAGSATVHSYTNSARNAADNASITPIAPMDNQLQEYADEDRDSAGGLGKSLSPWAQDPPSVTTGFNSGGYVDPLLGMVDPLSEDAERIAAGPPVPQKDSSKSQTTAGHTGQPDTSKHVRDLDSPTDKLQSI